MHEPLARDGGGTDLDALDVNVEQARVDDIEIVALVALADHRLTRSHLALKHGIDLWTGRPHSERGWLAWPVGA